MKYTLISSVAVQDIHIWKVFTDSLPEYPTSKIPRGREFDQPCSLEEFLTARRLLTMAEHGSTPVPQRKIIFNKTWEAKNLTDSFLRRFVKLKSFSILPLSAMSKQNWESWTSLAVSNSNRLSPCILLPIRGSLLLDAEIVGASSQFWTIHRRDRLRFFVFLRASIGVTKSFLAFGREGWKHMSFFFEKYVSFTKYIQVMVMASPSTIWSLWKPYSLAFVRCSAVRLLCGSAGRRARKGGKKQELSLSATNA